jgi:hypothetical protein
MDSGLALKPAIGPATSGRTRWTRPGMTKQKVRAQPIGISAAPNMTGQARGEGERMAGCHDKSQPHCLFRFDRFSPGAYLKYC